jgi:CBS domain-containing protein
MKVSQVMTKHVISIQPEATIVQAIKLMLHNRLSGLPVIDRMASSRKAISCTVAKLVQN